MLIPTIVHSEGNTVTEHGVTITSDKSDYFCEPVTSSYGCLFRTGITVKNRNAVPITATLHVDADKEIRIRDYSKSGSSIRVDTNLGRRMTSSEWYVINAGETIPIKLNFFAKETGNFNYSIEFLGNTVTLDPVFNVTYNSSEPSLYLIDGIVDQDDDDEFDATQNATIGLSDGSDATNFQVSTSQDSDIEILNFTDGSFEVVNNIVVVGDSAEVNFTLPDLSLIEGNIEVCARASKGGAGPVANVSREGLSIPLQFNLPVTATPTNATCVPVPQSFFTPGSQRVGIKCVTCASSPPNRIHIGTDSTSPDSTSYFFDGTYTRLTTQDYGIYLKYTLLNESSGDALHTSFPISIDSLNNYWLMTRKVTSGVSNITVYTYTDENMINLSNSLNFTITSGWDSIPLDDIVYEGLTASFRMYTQEEENISEVQLIEGVNDTTPPSLNEFFINDTDLGCDDYVRLRANVTDDNLVQTVFFSWNDTVENTAEADKIMDTDYYFEDIQYTHDTGGAVQTYTWWEVNATDLVGQSTVEDPGLDFNYTCDLTPLNVDILNPSDGDTFFVETALNITANVTSSLNISVVKSNVTLPNGSSEVSVMSHLGEGVYSSIFNVPSLIGTYTLVVDANDTSGSTDSDSSFFYFNESHFVGLISPGDGSEVFEGEVTFVCNATDSVHFIENISLYLSVDGGQQVVNSTEVFDGTGSVETAHFNITVSPGEYLWNCALEDSLGTKTFGGSNFSLTVNPAPLTFSNGDIECLTNPEPPYKNFMYWVCNSNLSVKDSLECLTKVQIEGQTVQINPERDLVKGVGEVNSFVEEGGIITPYFKNDGLREGREYTWVLECSDNASLYYFNATVTPEYVPFSWGVDRAVWGVDNASFIFGFVVLWGLIIVFLAWGVKKLRE